MAKSSGLGSYLYVAGYDLSGDVGAVNRIASPSGEYDVTGINKSARERIHGLYDGEIAFTAFFNDSTVAVGGSDQEHTVLKAKGSGADRVVCFLKGEAIGNAAAALVSKQMNYDMTRAADGSLAIDVQCLANGYGLDWCEQLTAGDRTDTAATDGASLDGTAATSKGLAAYLQVLAFTGTDATVKIQESSDDAAGDPYADVTGGAFTQVTSAPTTQRIVTSLTLAVERYLRVKTITTGGFTSLRFVVIASRYPVAA